MKNKKASVEEIKMLGEEKRWPVAITSAFLIVLIASFMPWGTINYHYTWQFMAYMNHPGLCNHIVTDDDLSGVKIGSKINYTGSAWKSGFEILGLLFPHWFLTVVALLLFVFAICNFLDYFVINSSIPQILSLYGIVHVISSALGFFSQGSIRSGLILTGCGYLIFIVSFLRWK